MYQNYSILALPQTKLEKLLSTILPEKYGVNYNPRLPDDDKLVQEYWVLVALHIHTDTYSAFVDVESKLEKLPVSNTSPNNIG
jgi:hypothetical protein